MKAKRAIAWAVCCVATCVAAAQEGEAPVVRFAVDDMKLEATFRVKGSASRLPEPGEISRNARLRTTYAGKEYVARPAKKVLEGRGEMRLPVCYWKGSVAWPRRWLDAEAFMREYPAAQLPGKWAERIADLAVDVKFRQAPIDDNTVLLTTDDVRGGKMAFVLFITPPKVAGGDGSFDAPRAVRFSGLTHNQPLLPGFVDVAMYPILKAGSDKAAPATAAGSDRPNVKTPMELPEWAKYALLGVALLLFCVLIIKKMIGSVGP